jgi:outer membrane protein assembly factor BamB
VVAGTTENEILAFDRVTGASVWSAELDDTGFTDPVVTDALVIVSEGNHVGHDGTRRLLALDLTTGLERWTFTADGRLLVAPAIGNAAIYTIAITGTLYALSALGGNP